jgi:hypothetical protein
MFLKDQWQDWARDWGLAHYPERGWLRRTEHILGERKGLLIRVGWGTDRNATLIVGIRFPKSVDLDRLRQALADDPSLDVLPGKGAARRKMAVESGAKKKIHLGHPTEFTLTEGSLTWWRIFPWSSPKPARVQAWVDALVDAVARATPVYDGHCETCATGTARRYVLLDGMPAMICSSCQQRLRSEGDMAEQSYDMLEAHHASGTTLGLVAAIVGGAGWAVVGALTGRMFVMAAIGIGALVAWAYRRGAGRVDQAGRVIAVGLTLASVTLGEILLYSWWVAKSSPAIGFDLRAGWLVYLMSWTKNPGENLVTMLFGLVGAWVANKALQRPKLRTTIEEAGASAGGQQKVA